MDSGLHIHLAPREPHPALESYLDETEEREPPGEGPAIPSQCLRVLHGITVGFAGGGCSPDCVGLQRDGGCLVDLIHQARAHGVEWEFALDREGNWVWDGEPLP